MADHIYTKPKVALLPIKDMPEYLVRPSFRAWECYLHPGMVIRNRAECQKCQLAYLTALSEEVGYK